MIFDRVFLKFILVGLINTLAGSALMFLLYNIAGLGYWVSSAANYAAGSVLSFFLNKYFTFNTRQWPAFMVIAFAVNIAAAYFAAYGIAKPAVNMLLRQAPQNIRENTALVTGMCLFTGINYMGQRFVVFKGKTGG
ncbi:MAG: GtrA family protein [Treponema sp.]|jgi:putative flippase GtrA|nr:GtrA family protein [Treponema sp.]